MLNVLGNLVSGTECLEHTLIFTQKQSMSRTLGNANYKAHAYSPKVSNQLLLKSLSLSRTSNYIDSTETAIGKQRLIFNEDVELDDASALILMNNSNFNTFTNWELREEYSKKVYVLTVIPDNRLKFSSSGYSCPCRTFMNEYVCEHALAISIVTKKSRNSIGLDLPVGKQKSRCRPKKAVKGALNHQSKEEAKAIK